MKADGEKILLVDDEEGIRKVLSISLADSGYQVMTAENAEQAIDLFNTRLFNQFLLQLS